MLTKKVKKNCTGPNVILKVLHPITEHCPVAFYCEALLRATSLPAGSHE